MQNILNDIKQNHFKRAYLLYGEERYLKNNIRTACTGPCAPREIR